MVATDMTICGPAYRWRSAPRFSSGRRRRRRSSSSPRSRRTARFLRRRRRPRALHPGAAPPWLGLAAALMAIGLRLHPSERHEHDHAHDEIEHDHLHSRDERHAYVHDGPVSEPHAHLHRHTPRAHAHSPYPTTGTATERGSTTSGTRRSRSGGGMPITKPLPVGQSPRKPMRRHERKWAGRTYRTVESIVQAIAHRAISFDLAPRREIEPSLTH